MLLRRPAVRQVVMVDLTKPEFGLPVVRVIVPGLEPILERGYTPGRRGRYGTGKAVVSVYVFAGPTISPSEASCELEAVYLPPAAEGDVYRVTLKRPQAIGIIDGYFQTTPTVRHKEILWAMSRRDPCIRQRQHRSPSCGGTCCVWYGGCGNDFRIVSRWNFGG